LSAERYASSASHHNQWTGANSSLQRKVRCDEAKPECNICLRRGTKCPGYRPTQSFILHKFDEQHDRPELIKEDESQYKFANQSPTGAVKVSASPESRAVTRTPGSQARPVDAPLPRRVSSIAADRIQHLGTFIGLYLPSTDGPALPPPSALMLALPSIPANSEVLLAAVDALSAAQLAVDKRNHPLINRSRSLYGTALSQMLKAIQDPTTALKDETLLSTYLLTLYEVLCECYVGLTQAHIDPGVRRGNAGPRFLLPCAGASSPLEAAWSSVFPEQTEFADLSCNTIQFSRSSDTA
jgi:hypothetical protein